MVEEEDEEDVVVGLEVTTSVAGGTKPLGGDVAVGGGVVGSGVGPGEAVGIFVGGEVGIEGTWQV